MFFESTRIDAYKKMWGTELTFSLNEFENSELYMTPYRVALYPISGGITGNPLNCKFLKKCLVYSFL